MYRQLDPQHICGTAEALARRIAERFPDSGLSRVSGELVQVAAETRSHIERLGRPDWRIRGFVLACVAAVLTIAVVMPAVRVQADTPGFSELMQGIAAAIDNVVFIAIAGYFLLTLERRVKRAAALKSLHELRSIAHIVDMHQLTKDPEHLLSPEMDTASSPKRVLSRFELGRYLDYCSEMLSITSKLAALYVQCLNDEAVMDGVNDIETLVDGLSARIAQKLTLLDSIAARIGAPAGPG